MGASLPADKQAITYYLKLVYTNVIVLYLLKDSNLIYVYRQSLPMDQFIVNVTSTVSSSPSYSCSCLIVYVTRTADHVT